MEDDERPPRRIEPPKGLVDDLAFGYFGREIDIGCRANLHELDLDRSASATSDRVDAGTHEQSMEPGVEPVRVAKARQVSPGSDESVLDRVSRELAIPEDQPGRSIQPRDGRASELGEGVMIAPLRLLDETPLVHCRL